MLYQFREMFRSAIEAENNELPAYRTLSVADVNRIFDEVLLTYILYPKKEKEDI